MSLTLYPGEALILFIRRSAREPTTYMVAIRACQTDFDQAKDLQPVNIQRTICEAGEFATLKEAMDAALDRLRQVASGSISL
jgi:hypothetical protein